jgi:hypothetical protein
MKDRPGRDAMMTISKRPRRRMGLEERQARPHRQERRHHQARSQIQAIGVLRRLQKRPGLVRAFFADPHLRYHRITEMVGLLTNALVSVRVTRPRVGVGRLYLRACGGLRMGGERTSPTLVVWAYRGRLATEPCRLVWR